MKLIKKNIKQKVTYVSLWTQMPDDPVIAKIERNLNYWPGLAFTFLSNLNGLISVTGARTYTNVNMFFLHKSTDRKVYSRSICPYIWAC